MSNVAIDLDHIEPDAARRMRTRMESEGYITEEAGQSMMTHSLAISMKRIADSLDQLVAIQKEMLK